MEKIIKGKRYSTRKAKEIGSWDHLHPGDFKHLSETMYRKKTGEYFLAGVGGPMTKYAEWVDDNNRTGGEKIFPLTIDEAKEWAEQHLTAEEYMAEFGDPDEEEDDYRTTLTVYIPVALHQRLRQRQSDTGKTMTQIVIETLEKELED